MESQRACPECHLSFEADLPATGVLVCPLCETVLSELPRASPVSKAETPSSSAATARQVLRGVTVVGAILFLAAGMGYAYYLLSDIDHKAAALPAPAAHAPAEPPSPPSGEYVPIIPNELMPTVKILRQPRLPIEPLPPVRIRRHPRPLKLQPPAIIEKPQGALMLPK